MLILSIDDDPGCQKAAARFLTAIGGHKVEAAYSGAEGLAKAARLKPDIILLDLRLPDMSGEQVLDLLLTTPSTETLPVVILTGADLNKERRRALNMRKNLRLLAQKPAGLSTLLRKMNKIVSPDYNVRPGADFIFKTAEEA